MAGAFASGRLAGAYLLTGPEGCGGWALFLALSALTNCRQPAQHDLDGVSVPLPCGQCAPCRLIYALNYEGLHFALPLPPRKEGEDIIDLTNKILESKRKEPFALLAGPGSQLIPIEVAREVQRRLALKANAGVKRMVLFYQMERMLKSSADALLKLIEEPPADSIIVMTARRPEELLPTIRSRARLVRLGRIDAGAIESYLIEKRDVEPTRAQLVARLADGSLGVAIELAKEKSPEMAELRQTAVELFTGLFHEPGPALLLQLLTQTESRNRNDALQVLRTWQTLIRDCAGLAIDPATNVTNVDVREPLQHLSVHFDGTRLAERMTQQIKLTLADLYRNVHIHGAMSALVLRLKACTR